MSDFAQWMTPLCHVNDARAALEYSGTATTMVRTPLCLISIIALSCMCVAAPDATRSFLSGTGLDAQAPMWGYERQFLVHLRDADGAYVQEGGVDLGPTVTVEKQQRDGSWTPWSMEVEVRPIGRGDVVIVFIGTNVPTRINVTVGGAHVTRSPIVLSSFVRLSLAQSLENTGTLTRHILLQLPGRNTTRASARERQRNSPTLSNVHI